MYINNKTNQYYAYDCLFNRYIYVADSMEEMISFIASRFNSVDFYGKPRNSFLDQYNCTFNDKLIGLDSSWSDFKLRLRPYIVFDSDMRIIDIRLYQSKILSLSRDVYYQQYRDLSPLRKYEIKNLPVYRREPIHNVGKFKYYGFRRPHSFQEKKINSNPEMKGFYRKKRQLVPDVYDDIYRVNSRCWKDQSKQKHQWEHNIKKGRDRNDPCFYLLIHHLLPGHHIGIPSVHS